MKIQMSMDWYDGEVIKNFAKATLQEIDKDINDKNIVFNLLKYDMEKLYKDVEYRLSITPKTKKINIVFESFIIWFLYYANEFSMIMDKYDEPSRYILIGVVGKIMERVQKELKKQRIMNR